MKKGAGKKGVVQFFIELGMLKRMPRTGWTRAGIQNPETVASHSYRTAMIAWALAKFESAKRTTHHAPPDVNKVIKMALLHDLEEARTGDLDFVMKNYQMNEKKAKAYSDILKNSPFAAEALSLVAELSQKSSLEAKIVKDADQLDLLLQSIEYESAGFKEAKKWKAGAKKGLKLKESKALAKDIEKSELNWWYK